MLPKLKITDLAVLLTTILLLYLGSWQLNRAEEKASLVNKLTSGDGKPIDISHLDLQDHKKLTFTSATCNGTAWLDKPILLDNQIIEHQAGYRVLLPFECDNIPAPILLDAGWVPKNNIDSIVAKRQRVIASGNFYWPNTGILLKKQSLPANITWPIVLQKLEPHLVEQALGRTISPVVLKLKENNVLSYGVVPKITIPTPPEKHKAYAIQWFSLAVVLMLYYSFNRRKLIFSNANSRK